MTQPNIQTLIINGTHIQFWIENQQTGTMECKDVQPLNPQPVASVSHKLFCANFDHSFKQPVKYANHS